MAPSDHRPLTPGALHLDMPRLDMSRLDMSRLAALATDAAYVAVGAAVMTFQKFQVARREAEQRVGPITLPNVARQLDDIMADLVADLTGKPSGD